MSPVNPKKLLKLASWNIHRCIGLDRAYRPDRIASVLEGIDADVVLLQEVDSSLLTGDGRDQLTFIAECTGMNFVMGPTLERDYGAYGNALLSRHPIRYFDTYDLSYSRYEPRGALAAGIEIAGLHLRAVNVHLGLKYWERAFQLDRLLSEIVWRDEALTVLAGDFNEWFPYAPNALRLGRCFPGLSFLPTFPAGWPKFILDRICVSGAKGLARYEVIRDELTRVASDHLPIVAELPHDGC